MATNCYDFELPVEICVDGPVGDGATATMSVFVTSFGELDIGSSPVGTTPGWDGSTVEFGGWGSGPFAGCTVLSSTISVTLIGDNEVEVTIEISVDCEDGWTDEGTPYRDCGGPGPHTFTDTKIVDMTGAPCT